MKKDNFKKCLFGGFNKKDVIAFFEELNDEMVSEKQDLEMENGELIKKNAQLEKQNYELEKANAELTTQIVEFLAKKQSDAEKDELLDSLSKQVEALKQENDTLKSAQISQPQAKDEVGEIILQAKKSADIIIAQAKNKGATITKQSLYAVRKSMDELDALTAQISELSNMVDEMVGVSQTQICDIQDKIESTKEMAFSYIKKTAVLAKKTQILQGENND